MFSNPAIPTVPIPRSNATFRRNRARAYAGIHFNMLGPDKSSNLSFCWGRPFFEELVHNAFPWQCTHSTRAASLSPSYTSHIIESAHSDCKDSQIHRQKSAKDGALEFPVALLTMIWREHLKSTSIKDAHKTVARSSRTRQNPPCFTDVPNLSSHCPADSPSPKRPRNVAM